MRKVQDWIVDKWNKLKPWQQIAVGVILGMIIMAIIVG
jgi:hypothetical protein